MYEANKLSKWTTCSFVCEYNFFHSFIQKYLKRQTSVSDLNKDYFYVLGEKNLKYNKSHANNSDNYLLYDHFR